MESLSTDNLMRLQVEQLEKEKKELNEKMRVLSKRLDHVERAYRKEERPLLAKDYELQQANDRVVFEAAQKARLEAHRQAHHQDVETKRRMTRMVVDFTQMKEAITARRGEEFAKKKELAQKKMEEEKSKRRMAVLKAREEERQRLEEEERIRREQEEEEVRLEAGSLFFPFFFLAVLGTDVVRSQSVSPRRSAGRRKRLLPRLPRRRRNARKRSARSPSARPGRRSASRRWKLLAGRPSARRRRCGDRPSASLRKRQPLPQPRLALPFARRRTLGVVRVCRLDALASTPRPGPRALLLPRASTALVLLGEEEVDGEPARLRSSKPLPRAPLHLSGPRLLLRRRLPGRSPRRRPMVSRRSRRRFGGARASRLVRARRGLVSPVAPGWLPAEWLLSMLCACCIELCAFEFPDFETLSRSLLRHRHRFIPSHPIPPCMFATMYHDHSCACLLNAFTSFRVLITRPSYVTDAMY